jgi:hypothetical protein
MEKSFVVIVLQENQSHQSPPNMPCARCGSTSVGTGAGQKPQEASLTCSDCKRFIRWVSVSELTRVAEGGEV